MGLGGLGEEEGQPGAEPELLLARQGGGRTIDLAPHHPGLDAEVYPDQVQREGAGVAGQHSCGVLDHRPARAQIVDLRAAKTAHEGL